MLLLFSGPCQRPDSLAEFLLEQGIEATQVDVVNLHLKDQNLLDDAAWGRIRQDLESGVYVALFAAPPCRTFSEVRSIQPGPPPLRDKAHPYGFPKSQAKQRGISDADLVKTREDNLLAERTAEACFILHQQGGAYGVEQPFPWRFGFSMFDLDSFKRLEDMGARRVVFDQCPYGGEAKKPTHVLYYGAAFASLRAECNHPVVTQYNSDGTSYRAPHPMAVGRDESGEFCTKRLAAYPTRLNRKIAKILSQYCRGGRTGEAADL